MLSGMARTLAAGLVFVSSGAVLVLEILGIRLLAPYVGLTLETTTIVIGTVLAGIAAGAALGGRAADRVDPHLLLAELLLAGGLLATAVVPVARTLGTALQGGGDAAALLVTLAALFPSATVLSAVTPTVAKLQLRDLRVSGSVVGRLSAWATAGALAGTFATGFVIVPLLATDVAVLGVAGVLLALGLAMALRAGVRSRRGAAALAAGAVLVAAATALAGSPCDAESTYHCVRVVEDPDRAGGRTLVLDDLTHSYVDLDDPAHLELAYSRWIADAVDGAWPRPRPLDAVFIGGGGFTLPRYVAATRPGSRSRVLEVDEAIVRVARERLDLGSVPGVTVVTGDARVTLRRQPSGSADLVVGDAFGGRSVPWHLATGEFASDVRRVLRPGGLYALNVIDHRPSNLVRALAATLLDRFGHVALVAVPGPDGAPAGGNVVFLASDAPLGPEVGSRAHGARTLDGAAVARLAGATPPLRDLDAPADQLLTPRP